MTTNIEDEGHKFCVICGEFGALNDNISYGRKGYTCWDCLRLEKWETGEKMEHFSNAFFSALYESQKLDIALDYAIKRVDEKDRYYNRLKKDQEVRKKNNAPN